MANAMTEPPMNAVDAVLAPIPSTLDGGAGPVQSVSMRTTPLLATRADTGATRAPTKCERALTVRVERVFVRSETAVADKKAILDILEEEE